MLKEAVQLPEKVADARSASQPMSTRWVYLFDALAELEYTVKPKSWEDVRALLGGKGANLAEMTRLDVPVPPGFTVTTQACNAYLSHDRQFPPGIRT